MIAAVPTTIDHATHTIRFERHFAASPAAVFDAWTDPQQIARWWDPTGTPLAACEVDLTVGGAFSFTMASHHAPPFAGVYRAIDRPATLVFDALGAEGTVHLTDEDGGTRMVVLIRCASAEHLAQFVARGVQVGTDRTLDNLVAFVGQRDHVQG